MNMNKDMQQTHSLVLSMVGGVFWGMIGLMAISTTGFMLLMTLVFLVSGPFLGVLVSVAVLVVAFLIFLFSYRQFLKSISLTSIHDRDSTGGRTAIRR